MALADEFKRADVLESLSWVGMSFEARCAKAASAYLDKESFIDDHSREYDNPTARTIGLLVRSLFIPPHGQGKSTIKAVLVEIERQRKIRDKRSENPIWKWKHFKVGSRGWQNKLTKRRNTVARRRYRIWGFDWDGKKTKTSPNCVAITRILGNLVMVDGGSYGTPPRIYIRSPAGEVKVVVIDGHKVSTVTGALMQLAPKGALRSMFEGKRVAFDFEGEGFTIDGELVPWENVRKIYHGQKQALKTAQTPEKKDK